MATGWTLQVGYGGHYRSDDDEVFYKMLEIALELGGNQERIAKRVLEACPDLPSMWVNAVCGTYNQHNLQGYPMNIVLSEPDSEPGDAPYIRLIASQGASLSGSGQPEGLRKVKEACHMTFCLMVAEEMLKQGYNTSISVV